MANARGKEVDTTCLSIEQAADRGFLHRDYIAHCLRWSHVVKYLHLKKRYAEHHVLDVGCGKEAPLPKMMFSSRMTHTKGSYTGVDYGKLEWPSTIPEDTKKFNATFMGETDFVNAELPQKTFDTIVSFEVLEHVEPWHSYSMLKRMREVCHDESVVFISTPCYDAKQGAAANHVNEMTYHALEMLILAAGFEVDEVYGTFASQKDYKPVMTEAQREMFDQLNQYYDSNMVACIFAPLFPEQSRNCLWKLKPGKPVSPSREAIKALKDPSSSEKWDAHIKKIRRDAK